MATAAEVRARLRAEGYDMPNQGRISGEHMAIYEGLAEADEAEVTAAGPPAEGEAEGPGEGASNLPAEVTPTRPRTNARQALSDRIRNRARSGRGRGRSGNRGRSGARRPVRERVSVSGVIEWGWAALAQAVNPISRSTARVLAMQAPVAGDVLEDSIKGTFADRVLQPIARGQHRISAAGALFLLPASIAGLEAAEGLPERPRAVRRAFLIPAAHHGAVLWLRVAGPKIQERIARDQAEGPVYQQAAEMLLMMDLPFLRAEDLGIEVPPPGYEGAPGGQTASGYPPEGGAPLTEEQARDMAAEAAQRFGQG